jgi:hypothetical protein
MTPRLPAKPTPASRQGNLAFALSTWDTWDEKSRDTSLVPFADGGATGGQYRVQLREAH